jgi:hypothetical protein
VPNPGSLYIVYMENPSLALATFWVNWSIIFIYLALPTRAGSPQQHMPITVGPFTSPTLSTSPVGGNWSTRRKPMTFSRVITLLFSHEVGFESHWESSHWDLNLRP